MNFSKIIDNYEITINVIKKNNINCFYSKEENLEIKINNNNNGIDEYIKKK